MKMRFFKCKVCGKVIAILKDTDVPTVCCGEEMIEIHAGTTDGAVEKHVPVITTHDNIVEINVGSVAHPMEDKHYIEWIALQSAQGIHIKTLQPGQEPKATFAVVDGNQVNEAYAYCNLHGLWSSK